MLPPSTLPPSTVPAATLPAATLPAATLGKYELREPIGSGSSGTVYDAWDPDLARRVAIKRVQLLGRTEAEQQELRARFRQEAQIVGRLSHPGVVSVYDYGEQDSSIYLVMEFVDGDTLAAVLQGMRQRHETMAPARAVAIVQAMLHALAHCHANGVLHRDIKPANVLLARDGTVKLTDFGIARTEASELTAQGTLIGTPTYMSPEQFEANRPVDARSDQYACGVVLYELLTASKPFEGDLFAVMHQVRTEQPVPPSRASAAVPPALDAIVLRAMAKQPEERFADAESFAAALQAGLQAPSPPPARRRWPMVVAGVAGLAVLGGVVWQLAEPDAVPARGRDRALALMPAQRLPQLDAPVPPPAAAERAGALPSAGPSLAPDDAAAVAKPDDALAAVKPDAPAVARPTNAPVMAQPGDAAAAVKPDAIPAPTQPDAALLAVIGRLPCASIAATWQSDPPVLRLRGIVGDATARDGLAPLLSGLPGTVEREALRVFPAAAPLCQVADLVAAVPARGARLGLLDGTDRLLAGDPIRVTLQMPDFAGGLRLDYVTDGGRVVVHLDPAADPARRWDAGARIALGPAGDGVIGSAGEPYGTDMILVTVAERPLLPVPRAGQEPAAPYLAALRAAMLDAGRRGEPVAADALVLGTAPR